MENKRVLSFTVEKGDEGERLDKTVCAYAPELSRSFIQKVLDDGGVTVNGKSRKKSYAVEEGDEITVTAPELMEIEAQPQDVTAAVSTDAVFTVEVANTVGAVKYRWYFSKDGGTTWGACGNNTDTLVMNATYARSGYQFRCTISDETGNVITSNSAVLTVVNELA